MKINRTKQLIADTLKSYIHEVPLKKITVQMLCDKCNVNRGTFYYHFKDISDLVCWIYHMEITLDSRGIGLESQKLITYTLNRMNEDREFYCQAWHREGQNNLPDFAAMEFNESFAMMWDGYLTITNRQPKDGCDIRDILRYFAQAHYFAISEWVKSGMKMPTEQMSKLLYTVSYTGIMAALREASEPIV
ncbi:MAG: TetR/AcrR family transcriptional regulator C-terminal domain-containing protein [Eubacteriales bacterium]